MHARRSPLLFLALAAAGALTPEALAAAPRYAMRLDPAQAEHGVKTVSFVQNPAIQRNWVTLAAVEPTAPAAALFHLSETTEGGQPKQVLTGPALVPGQQILRLDEKGDPFYIVFDAQTIEDTAIQFAAQGHHTSTNQAHAVGLTGNVVYESWIVVDAEKDKAAALGLAVEPGMWMLSVKVADADYWQTEVVSGNVRGFSIEGLFEQQQLTLAAPTEQLTLSAAKPTRLSSMFDWLKNLRSTKLSAEKVREFTAALGLEQLADGRAVQIDDTTGAVCVCGPDGTPGAPLEDGTHALANGGELVVQGGVRVDGENLAADGAKEGGTEGEKPAAPAPLADTATTPDIVQAINGILDFIKNGSAPAPKEDPAVAPAGQKLATQLHGVAVAELKLDAIDLKDGEKLTYNTVTRRLTDKDGALVDSGYYAAGDGSYFQVDISQYIWEISKSTYDAVYGAKLQSVELEELKIKLATQPAAGKVHLHQEQEGSETGRKSRLQLAREVEAAAK